MAAISVRNLDEDVASRLKVLAARHVIQKRFAAIGGVELEIPRRHDRPRAADLHESP
ncbi:MAG: FitA-like ribbon-helix-helix domain-containing protein [Mycobacteriales bacterium]